jgi:acyl carrier protein
MAIPSDGKGIDLRELESETLEFLQGKIAEKLGVPKAELDWDRTVLDLGMNSAQIVEVGRELEAFLGIRIPLLLFFKYPIMSDFVRNVIEQNAPPVSDDSRNSR